MYCSFLSFASQTISVFILLLTVALLMLFLVRKSSALIGRTNATQLPPTDQKQTADDQKGRFLSFYNMLSISYQLLSLFLDILSLIKLYGQG